MDVLARSLENRRIATRTRSEAMASRLGRRPTR